MQTIALLLPLLLLVTPAIAHGQEVTITAPPRSTLNSLTVTVLNYTHLDGTWNFVNGYGNVSGTITFGTEDLCKRCQLKYEHQYGFSGIFNGQPVAGIYDYIIPGPINAGLDLEYTYHHHKVIVMGNVNIMNPDHMELTNITDMDANNHHTQVLNDANCCNMATGLHLHYGDIIHLMRGGYNHLPMSSGNVKRCPPGMYLDKTGIYTCHDAAGTDELAPANMTNQWHRAW